VGISLVELADDEGSLMDGGERPVIYDKLVCYLKAYLKQPVQARLVGRAHSQASRCLGFA
jgi:hypothetical protein